MAQGGPEPEVQLQQEGSTLVVSGKLRAVERAAFADGLKVFGETDSENPMLDITGVDVMASECMALIALAMEEAREKGRTATVLATPGIAWFLELGGLDKLGEIRVVKG
jgi:anti-anti-sigma regulatory factor